LNRQLYIKRRESGLYQREVAEKLGIHKQTYCRKEKGEQDFTIREARMLAQIFNCTLDELFGDEKHVS